MGCAGSYPCWLPGSRKAAMREAAASTLVKERYAVLGAEPRAGTPEAFRALIRRETAKWAKVVQYANAKAK